LCILTCLGRRQLRCTLGTLALERVIAAGVQSHLPALQMQDMVNDIV
jgi:hypothetical protein